MSAHLPRFTVVTICRNALAGLRRTVETVLGQRYLALEYWIVDGASTDGTVEYLRGLDARRVSVLSEPDRGISDAMNKGLSLASGEWVAFLHAGDEYLPGALATVGAIASVSDAEVLAGYILRRERTGDVLCRCDPSRLRNDMTINHPATWVRRATFERCGGFDPALKNAMDYDLFLRLHLAGVRFHVVPQPLVVMPEGGQSDRSLWATLEETHQVRRRHLRAGWQRSPVLLWWYFIKGTVRVTLQRMGLNTVVAWYRRHLARPRKG